MIAKISAIVSFQLGLGDCNIDPGKTLLDVGADSLDVFEIVSRCEETFEVALSDDDVDLLSTVADIAAVISGGLRIKAKAETTK